MTISLAALAMSRMKRPSTWTGSDLDDILVEGDRIYNDHKCHGHLFATDLPKQFEINGIAYTLTMQEAKGGSVFSNETGCPYYTLESALRESFNETQSITGLAFKII